MQTHTHIYPNAKSADRRRMMDERSWASKMGEEDDESGRRWCVGRRRCVSFGGGGENNDESVRMMDEEDDGWIGKSLRRMRVWWWIGGESESLFEKERMSVKVKEIEKERKKEVLHFNESGNKKCFLNKLLAYFFKKKTSLFFYY